MPTQRRQSDFFSAASMIAGLWRYACDVTTVLRMSALRWQADDAATLAAAVAYYLALSVFPMLLLLSSGLGIFLKFTHLGQDAQNQILAVVAEHCSPALEQQVRLILLQFENQSVVSGPFGLGTAVLAAIGVFHQFERGFDKIWGISKPGRTGAMGIASQVIGRRLVAFCMLCGVGFMVVTVLLANIAISLLRQWMTDLHLPGIVLITLVDASATLILNTLAFAILYRTLPKRRVRWLDAFRSGLLVALIWEIAREFLLSFLIGMRYTTTYGAIGSFIALLLWFYWGVAILFFGAEYLQVLSQRRQQPQNLRDDSSTQALAYDPLRRAA